MDEEMKKIVSALKPLFDQINTRFDQVDARFDSVEATVRRTAIEVSNLKGDVLEMRLDMATKHDLASHDKKLAGFISEVETCRKERKLAERSYLRHEDRLDDHQKRLARLETRRT